MRGLKHIHKIFFKKHTLPNSLTFFVTNKCNARCKHCFYWEELDKNKKLLSLDEIDSISRSLNDLLLLVLSGGEPFLRNDLDQIAITFYNNNHINNLVIPTNGLSTDVILNTSEKILTSCKNMQLTVYISFEDVGEEHDAFRGVKGIFENAVNSFRRLSLLKKKYANLNVLVLMTIHPDNQKKATTLYDRLKADLSPEFISPILMRSHSALLNSKNVDIKYYDQIREQIKRDILSKNLTGHARYLFSGIVTMMILKKLDIISRTVKSGYQIPCYAGQISGVIYEDGSVYPCEMLDSKLGNLRDHHYDFRQIWSSKNAVDVRRYIRHSNCFCTYECAMDTNILFNPAMLIDVCRAWVALKARHLLHHTDVISCLS